MKKIFLLIACITFLNMNKENNINGQTASRESWTDKKAKEWMDKGEWKNGLKVSAHPSVNAKEFAYQYHLNKPLWDKAFEFLRKTDLDTISAGKYILDGENLFVSVTESAIKPFEESKWEAHKKYIDIQYVIQGKEKMGIIPFEKVSVLELFNETKDLGFYTAPEKEARYYEATPEAFLIFFPGDAHRPAIRIPGFDANKKLVVKIKAD